MKVFWDTNLFIYLFEEYGELTEAVLALEERMRARAATLVTSTLTIGEILVRPISLGLDDVATQYDAAIRRQAMVVPFDGAAIRNFARIRASGIRQPDAIQLACAAAAGVNLFVTNDDRLTRRNIPGAPIVTSLAKVPI
jgi:predicted nucleic acid-binding protein